MTWSNPPAIIGVAFRLPGGTDGLNELWNAFCNPEHTPLSSVPDTRCFRNQKPFLYSDGLDRAGWLGPDGVEQFDPVFFNITPGEAETLRPNARLALELTWEALERAGVRPSSLRGKNVSTFIAMGAEDGWDTRRYIDDGVSAFNHHWAANADPSGVSGRIAHFFDFRGPTATISSACSSAASALREGVFSLLYDNCDISIVGAITTHFSPAAFEWARNTGLSSENCRCSAFSADADGYVASEGAVFFVLTRSMLARAQNYPIYGEILSVSTAHNGATRTFTSPSVSAQVQLADRALRDAGISAKDVNIIEAHGTGTRLGDAMEMEGIIAVHSASRSTEEPLYVSSSKTLLGHCQAAACFVGILKILCCFENHALPPHLVKALDAFTDGPIQIPSTLTALQQETPLIAQVNSFGFTGSIATVVVREALRDNVEAGEKGAEERHDGICYLLPFSAKSEAALIAQIRQIYNWAQDFHISVRDAAAALSLGRDHHHVRRLIPIACWDDLLPFIKSYTSPASKLLLEDAKAFLTGSGLDTLLLFLGFGDNTWDDETKTTLDTMISQEKFAEMACLLYERGYLLKFRALYPQVALVAELLRTMPTYPFQRQLCWRGSLNDECIVRHAADGALNVPTVKKMTSTLPATEQAVTTFVASVLQQSISTIDPDANIFDVGIDSLNSIELADNLSKTFGRWLGSQDLYQLLTVRSICSWINEGGTLSGVSFKLCQEEFDHLVFQMSDVAASPLPTKSPSVLSFPRNILLTGANGMLGSHVLYNLLKQLSVRVFCLVRGDAWAKIESSFALWDLDIKMLYSARDSNRVVVFSTSELADENLGCSESEYSILLDCIDEVMHLAWKTNFNTPVAGFNSLLKGTKNLALFSIRCRKLVRLHFVSSISTVVGYDRGQLVPEERLPSDTSYCLVQGYAYSKSVAEHSLYHIQEKYADSFLLCVIRVGQICGHSKTGLWSQDEMLPKIILSIPTLQAVPSILPDVSWIPSDVCANVLCDIVLDVRPPSHSPRVYNVANPTIMPWLSAVELIEKSLEISRLQIVTLSDYIALIRSIGSNDLPIAPLLPFLQSLLDLNFDTGNRSCSLDVSQTSRLSKALRFCPKVDQEFMRLLVKSLFQKMPILSKSVIYDEYPNPVLIFGTWASIGLDLNAEEHHNPIRMRIRSIADDAMRDCNITNPIAETAVDLQLQALEAQLLALDELVRRNIMPCAVVGYSFGEFAAAVAARILSEEEVIQIIVRRAASIQNVEGAMLNVFVGPSAVRQVLSVMRSAPSIGIYAGPKHTILSGSLAEIAAAEDAFESYGAKTAMVKTTIPFHSHILADGAKAMELPSVSPHDGVVSYISGVTGTLVRGRRLGAKYWQRHMREPAQFYSCMQYVREHFPAATIIDMGPGHGIMKLLSRYGWDNTKYASAQTFLAKKNVNTGTPSKRQGSRLNPNASIASVQSLLSQPSTLASAVTNESWHASTTLKNESTTSNAIDKRSYELHLGSAMAILSTQFGYRESDDLLLCSFHDLGIQSLDFIHFTEQMCKVTGLDIQASSFNSEKSIREIIVSASSR